MDLEAYAEKREAESRSKSRCITCNLDPDVLRQIEAARQREPKPIPFPMISAWLENEHGIKIQHATIRNHFIAGHVQ